jgi:hypothetical protein
MSESFTVELTANHLELNLISAVLNCGYENAPKVFTGVIL